MKKARTDKSVQAFITFIDILNIHFQERGITMKYRRMTYTDRLIIEKLFNSGNSYRAIARITGFNVSSVYREIQRGLYDHLDGGTYIFVKRYSATIAHDDATFQASSKGQMIKLGSRYDYANAIASRIKNGESPDAIVGDLKSKGEWTVSTPTLYRYIDKGFIPQITNKNLLVKSRKKKRTYHKVKAAKAPKGISIERRPEHINNRQSFGHWEMDLVIGKKQKCPLLVLTERMTRFEIIHKLANKTADSVVTAIDHIINRYPYRTFQTITVDNGSEFSDYLSMKLYVDEVYYCHPYTSCERGSNENANRIIRRWLPKGTDFRPVTQNDCSKIADTMNNMHRKILGYHTAAELFAAELARL